MNDGGFAFPLQYDPFVDHPVHGRIHRGFVGEEIQSGMTLRDYFAAKALVGLCTDYEAAGAISQWNMEGVATAAYKAADAMLAERARESKGG